MPEIPLRPDVASLGPVELFAWLGEDELGSGEIGLKQADVPAGRIALVSIKPEKAFKYRDQMEIQAKTYGKRIRLVRFAAAEIIYETEAGT